MLDWIISKTTMSFVAIILIILSLLFFGSFSSDNYIANTQLENIASSVALEVNQALAADGETVKNISFAASQNGRGLLLPAVLDGEQYHLQIGVNMIKIIFRDQSRSDYFNAKVHLYPPSELFSDANVRETSLWKMKEVDGKNPLLEFSSGNDFYVETAQILLDGAYVYHTFVYLV